MAATKIEATVLLLIMLSVYSTNALNIAATMLLPKGPGQANSFIAPSDSIGSSLLGSGVASVLWAMVSSGDVTSICQQIVSTGSLSFSLTVTNNVDGSVEDLTIQITHTGGCEAAPDESGTEAVWVDNKGRRSALVCPKGAGSYGCGVFLTGDVVTQLYNQAKSGRKLLANVQDDCGPMVGFDGVLLGLVVFGITGSMEACVLALPLALPFCAALWGATGLFFGALVQSSCGAVGCFPGDALLQLPGGGYKSMAELDLGDKVAVWNSDGSLGYDDIYAFGHRDGNRTTRFYQISMSTTEGLQTSLELTGLHFAPILSRGIGGEKVSYLRAQEIQIGDMMLASGGKELALYSVTGISIIVKQGVYNPFTMAGTIVVNGVVASVHSDWFLDGVFETMGLTSLLPALYQVILSPPRMLYKVIGKEWYIIIYNWLDENINLVQLISDYSGSVASFLVACTIGAPLYFLKRSK